MDPSQRQEMDQFRDQTVLEKMDSVSIPNVDKLSGPVQERWAEYRYLDPLPQLLVRYLYRSFHDYLYHPSESADEIIRATNRMYEPFLRNVLSRYGLLPPYQTNDIFLDIAEQLDNISPDLLLEEEKRRKIMYLGPSEYTRKYGQQKNYPYRFWVLSGFTRQLELEL